MKHLGTRKIETERLILRQFSIMDAEDMYRNWASDPEVTQFLTWPTHTSVSVTQRVIDEWQQASILTSQYLWCIESKALNQAIGNIGVVKLNEDAESAEIGYCLGRAFWNKGLATEAFGAVIDFLFGQVGLNRIAAECNVDNAPSGRVMEKCGLTKEGVLREAKKCQNGFEDMAVYSILLKEWKRKEVEC